MTTFVELFDAPVDDPWWKPAVPSFRRATEADLKPGYVDGYVIDVPLMEPAVYLPYLEQRFTDGDGTMDSSRRASTTCTRWRRRSSSTAQASAPAPSATMRRCIPSADRWCVCLTRGSTVRLDDDHGPLALTYIIPRRSDCILGGTAEKGVWGDAPSDETTAAILERARTLEPRLHDAEVIEVRAGLRPGRDAVRLEMEHTDDGRALIHNYGHGGAGYTLAWGCADEVVALAAKCR